jgi:RNA polymerase sigma-70 factor (ECF subfamily)
LIQQARSGDPRAEADLIRRYEARLVRLARNRLCAKLGRRLDAEDVVQSAYRTFFGHLRAGRYEFSDAGDVWRLMAAITLRKLHRQVQWHGAGKRTVLAEESQVGWRRPGAVSAEAMSRGPSPERVAEVLDELEFMFATRPPSHRRIVELRLCGEEIAHIARQVPCCQRTVHRVLTAFRRQLNQRLAIA